MENENLKSGNLQEVVSGELEFLRLNEELNLKAKKIEDAINLFSNDNKRVGDYNSVLLIINNFKNVIDCTYDVNLKIDVLKDVIAFVDCCFDDWYKELELEVTKNYCFIKRLILKCKVKARIKKRRKALEEIAKLFKTKYDTTIDVDKLSLLY